MHYGFGGFGGFGMILVWIAVIAAIVILIKMVTAPSGGKREKHQTPIDILEKRYASGEISKEEFEEKKHDLAH